MWTSKPRNKYSQEILERAQLGLINETLLQPRSLLGRCCRDLAKGDFNYEVLCFNHMQSFNGFLDMIEEPNEKEGSSDNGEGMEDNHHKNTTIWSSNSLRISPACMNQHWSPVSSWRMEKKFYPQLNFIGHLETAQWDIHRLMDRLHPNAYEKFAASGWGQFRNESMFESASTVNHFTKSINHLLEHYTSKDIEERVENIYKDDYDNIVMDLERVAIGNASSFYRERFLKRYGSSYSSK